VLVGNRIPTFRDNVPSCSMVKYVHEEWRRIGLPTEAALYPRWQGSCQHCRFRRTATSRSHGAQHPITARTLCGPLAGRTWGHPAGWPSIYRALRHPPTVKHRSVSRNRQEAFFESENAILWRSFVRGLFHVTDKKRAKFSLSTPWRHIGGEEV